MPYIKLRAAQMSDLEDFHEFFSDADVMRYWYFSCHTLILCPPTRLTAHKSRSTPPHTELSRTEKFLRNMVDARWNGLCDFVIEYAPPSDPPKTIGKLGLWDGHEIGLMLNRAFWGQGLMREAMDNFFREVWRNDQMQSLQEIIADVDPRNSACIALLKKFGFRETGYREKTCETHLGWCDSLDLHLNRPRDPIN